MNTHPARLHLAGLAAALLAGGLLGFLLRPEPEVVTTQAAAPAAPAGGPQLRGAATAEGSTGPAPGAGRDAGASGRRVRRTGPGEIEIIDAEVFVEGWDEVVLEVTPQRGPEQDRSVRGSLAHATLRALEGDGPGATTQLVAALGDGAREEEVLFVCELLEGDAWVQAVERMREVPLEWTWDAATLADRARDAGAPAWGWDLLVRTIDGAETVAHDVAAALLRNDPARAGALLMARVRADPDALDKDLQTVVIQMLEQAGAHEPALAFLAVVAEQRPFDDDLLSALENMDSTAAEAYAQRRVAERPDDTRALRTLANAYSEHGETDKAQQAWRRLAELNPEPDCLRRVIAADPKLGLELALRAAAGTRSDELLGTLGMAYASNGDTENAYLSYARAQAIDPEDCDWLRPLVELDPRRATETLAESALATAAGDELIGAYANALLASGRPDEAGRQYERALQKDGTDSEWQLGLAQADPRRALEILYRLHDANPDDAYGESALGLAQVGSGQRVEGLARIESAVRRSPDFWTLRCLYRADMERAETVVQRLLENEPQKASWHGMRGELLEKRGLLPEARAAFARAHELEPADAYWVRRLATLRARR